MSLHNTISEGNLLIITAKPMIYPHPTKRKIKIVKYSVETLLIFSRLHSEFQHTRFASRRMNNIIQN